MLDKEQPREPRDWPFDQSYENICPECGKRYGSPKRARPCWECATDAVKEWWVLRGKGE